MCQERNFALCRARSGETVVESRQLLVGRGDALRGSFAPCLLGLVAFVRPELLAQPPRHGHAVPPFALTDISLVVRVPVPIQVVVPPSA